MRVALVLVLALALTADARVSRAEGGLILCRDLFRWCASGDGVAQRWQRRIALPVGTELSLEEFAAPTAEISDLHPSIIRGLIYFNEQIRRARREASPNHAFEKQKDLDPQATSYYVLQDAASNVAGFGALIDGTSGRKVALEREFPHLDLRRGGKRQVMEVARLGSERGRLRHVFRGMADHILRRYGSESVVPESLDIVLWTTQPGLTAVYHDRYGFELRNGPDSLGRRDAWVMSMTGREFIRRYAVEQSGGR